MELGRKSKSYKSQIPIAILKKYVRRKARVEQLADRAVGGAELEPGSLAVSLTGPLARERLNTVQYTQHSLTLRNPYITIIVSGEGSIDIHGSQSRKSNISEKYH